MVEQGIRFLLVGIANTLITYSAYCVLVYWWPPQIAWAVVYVAGIAVNYVLHSRWVFGAKLATRRGFVYVGLYLFQYLMSSLLIQVLMEGFDFGPRLAAAISIAIVVPMTFILMKLLFRREPGILLKCAKNKEYR